MSEMVERVALALQQRAQERGIKPIPGFVASHLAAAAIEAMREPTVAMIEAEPDGDGEFDKTNSAAHAKAFWQAMIDEALR